MSSTSKILRSYARATLICIGALAAANTAVAQPYPGNPRPDINVVGPTRDPVDIRDEGLKQQNEPACAMRPGDSDCIICFFNDYRTVDIPGHEDAWIGQAESCDAGNTWTSRIVPGHPNYFNQSARIDANFVADPRVIHLPGMAIHGFIGGFRDQDRGVIAVQHWLENNKDDFDYYEPGLNTIIVDEGTEGRFIDKPDFLAVLDESVPQGTVSISTLMENPALGTTTREYPAGTLYAAYAVFTGSQSVKLLVKTSDDWGVTWRNKTTKLTESQNVVSGITMTAMDGIIVAMWRQVLDTNDVDAIYYATTTNDGQNWSKPSLLTNICKFDQPSATFQNQVTFRTNDFPWLANDGKNIYAFFTERLGSCASGAPKVVMRYTNDGSTWHTHPTPVSDGPGASFMPAAFGARGKVQVAWYDTRREGIPFTESQPYIADFIPGDSVRVNRKVDVYTARVTTDSNGIVQVSDSARVSRYRTVTEGSDPFGPRAMPGPVYEVEASFANAMMFKSGLLAFLGDYISVTAEEFRPRDGGGWEENHSALPSPASNLIDFFVAYADNRDVRGDILFGDGGMTKPYTPPVNVPAGADATETGAPTPFDEERVLVASADANEQRQSAEGVEDFFTDPLVNVCGAPDIADRTRDANIYGSVIRDELRLSSPVESRPLSGILRAIPFAASNSSDQAKGYRLYIANQPGANPLLHRASFRQKPDRAPFVGAPDPVLVEDVTIQPNSTVARTVFVVSPDLAATVDIQIFDGVCATNADASNPGDPLAFANPGVCDVLGSITVGGVSTAGDIRQPDYLSSVCGNDPACADVLVTELHNPLIENPLIENPLIENPLIENPLIENPLIENPLIENPLIENYGFENPLIENPLIENPLIENSSFENPLIENPLIENPLIENTALVGTTYADVTAVIRNDGNVTTAYNVDATTSGFGSTAGGAPVSQLILWKQYVYGSARNCQYVAEGRDQVVATINQPDNQFSLTTIDEPFNGEASIILAPGEQGFITYRFWGTPSELATARLKEFTASSQAANCDEFDDDFGPPPGSDPNDPADIFYACQDQIATGVERILLDLDTSAPVFANLVDNQVIPVPAAEANTRGGACFTDPIMQLGIDVSDDSGLPVTVTCTNAEGDEICTFAGEPNGLSVPVANLLSYNEYPPVTRPSPMTCTAVDGAGNSASITLNVEVLDETDPFFIDKVIGTVTVPADAVTGTAQVNLETGFTAADVDGVDPSPVIGCLTADGLGSDDDLPAGLNTVTCTVTDASGNSSDAPSYTVNVNDVTPPAIFLTGDNPQIIEAGAPYEELGATATDNVGVLGAVSVNASAVVTSTVGSYDVIYTASDANDNQTTVIRTVEVRDTVPPEFDQFPLDIIETAMPDGTVTIDFVATATDGSGVAPTISCVPPSGSVFAVGTTSVTCTATDAAGNRVSQSFSVTVEDETAPELTVPTSPVFEQIMGPAGAVVDYDHLVSATDTVDPSPTIDCMPESGLSFAPGDTVVNCTATDASGNSTSASFTVTVGYANGVGITATKLSFRAGSSNPLTWAWQDENGNNVDASNDMQMLSIVDCDDPSNVVLSLAGDPGSSGIRIKSDLAFEYNWQADCSADDDNDGCVDDSDDGPLPRGTYCASVTSDLTGQSLLSDRIRVR